MSGVLDGLNVLITGGTGSWGHKCIEVALRDYKPARLIVFSRDELKQSQMRERWPDGPGAVMRYFIGDVRDVDRLRMAFKGVDVVFHAAALKRVEACEYNIDEAIKTNVDGARNVIRAALDCGVKRVVALSTDKSTNATTGYGATKLAAERLFVQSNAYAGKTGTKFAAVRYGNVLGSRGSVVLLFREQAQNGRVLVNHPEATRFWITLDQAVEFVLSCLPAMQGGEVFVPKIPSMSVLALAKTLAPHCEVVYGNLGPAEKMHESLIGQDEARRTVDLGDRYAILPAIEWWPMGRYDRMDRMPEQWSFCSNTNERWLEPDDLLALIGEPVAQAA